jgi:hypothetical protein
MDVHIYFSRLQCNELGKTVDINPYAPGGVVSGGLFGIGIGQGTGAELYIAQEHRHETVRDAPDYGVAFLGAGIFHVCRLQRIRCKARYSAAT